LHCFVLEHGLVEYAKDSAAFLQPPHTSSTM
jgi:hypothetical protein